MVKLEQNPHMHTYNNMKESKKERQNPSKKTFRSIMVLGLFSKLGMVAFPSVNMEKREQNCVHTLPTYLDRARAK